MEQLPAEIEQKIENLPIIALDAGDEFQNLILSQEFTDIFNYYKENYLTDILKTKPELYQRISLYLTLTNQDTAFLEQTDQVLYKRHCPSIEEFLNSKFYMGYSNATLYPWWRERLMEIFAPNSPIRKTIFGGSIGVGKSTVARKAFLYVLYRVLCLRYPRAVFNVDADATLMAMIISMTLQQVYETNMLPFTKLLETMPCFQKVMSMRSFENFDLTNDRIPIPYVVEKSTATVYFPDNIIIGCGSGMNHTIGKNLFTTFLDEMNEKGVEDALELLNSVDNRFSSRFAGVDLVFQSIVSSARTTNSPIGEYIKRLPKNDPSILILSPKLWDIKTDPAFLGDGSTFPVMVGNGSIPSKIITDPGELKAIEDGKYTLPTGCEIIQVPTVYKSKFELQLDQSIQDIAGMTTSDNNSVFRDTTLLQDTELTPEIQLEANLKDNTDLLACLPPRTFEKNLQGKWQFCRAPLAERYVHLDLSGGGSDGQCDSGICVLHKEWQLNPMTNQKDTIYVVDLIIAVNAKNKIDLQAIQNFIINLVVERNVNIHTVSADQYQCLAGDTKIDLLNGESISIKEIVNTLQSKTYYTYTYDTINKKIVPGKIIGGKKTGHKQLYKITLDNGQEIKCTEDHLFLLRDCTYKKAIDLTTSDSLMALYKDKTKKNYELTYNPASQSWKETYKRIAEYEFGNIEKGMHIHHRDFNKHNNEPTNLITLTKDAHLQLHREHPNMLFLKSGVMAKKAWEKRRANPEWDRLIRQKISESRKEFEKTKEGKRRKKIAMQKRAITLKNNPHILDNAILATKESFNKDNRKRANELSKRITEINKTLKPRLNSNTSIEARKRFSIANKNTWMKEGYKEKMKLRYPGACAKLFSIFGRNYKEKLKNGVITQAEIDKVKNDYRLEWLAKHRINHKIVSIEKIDKEDVYDIQIDNFPNFALSAGVFVHNSMILLQTLESSGCFTKVEKVSVDTKPEPYLNAARLIESGMVKIGTCPKLIKELEALIWQKGKVTRTTELKDMADSLAGALYNAQLNYTDQPQTMYINSKIQEKEFEYTDLIDTHLQQLEDI